MQTSRTVAHGTKPPTYLTPGISTGHCQAAIIEELARLDGINSVVVDLEARLVRVPAEQTDDAA